MNEIPPTGAHSAPESAAGQQIVCPNCGVAAEPGDLFCENCGQDLPDGVSPIPADGLKRPGGMVHPGATTPTRPADMNALSPVCRNCAGTTFLDGYCENCGTPAVKIRDHWQERPAAWVAAVSDRGVRHHRNEDGMAVSARPEHGSRAVLVVCDGVSSSADSDIASLAAARAARDVLDRQQADLPSVAGRISAWTERLALAGDEANKHAVEAGREPSGRPGERLDNPPSCTFAAAVFDSGVIVAGWVGDSRIYWIPDSGEPEQMSRDDSWATEQILAGVPREEAENGPRAHAITRWLGPDSPDTVPTRDSRVVDRPGWLLVCSDGLWNYCSPAHDMAELVRGLATEAQGDPALLANRLVDWANSRGGQDNITVALARVAPVPPQRVPAGAAAQTSPLPPTQPMPEAYPPADYGSPQT
ncbi:protein phosphatase 2C domain-containing protein [Kineosporia rhizophila]|uniref:protein phosphatase 2C domain-containing protein n=1 Tax=Kineosporia TaxID=49184 RepID=UPI001E355541|nr:protein phosphatase 2C domain-containing protein [Kineosporia sp. NBRC 101677]MCE0536753.1 protein phosphatase 2C domain-containing protein [Kineosporia rhizophila]